MAYEKEQIAVVMLEHGIEWEKKGTHEKHLSVLDFEKRGRAKEISELKVKKLLPGVGAVGGGGDLVETKIIADWAYKCFLEK